MNFELKSQTFQPCKSKGLSTNPLAYHQKSIYESRQLDLQITEYKLQNWLLTKIFLTDPSIYMLSRYHCHSHPMFPGNNPTLILSKKNVPATIMAKVEQDVLTWMSGHFIFSRTKGKLRTAFDLTTCLFKRSEWVLKYGQKPLVKIISEISIPFHKTSNFVNKHIQWDLYFRRKLK